MIVNRWKIKYQFMTIPFIFLFVSLILVKFMNAMMQTVCQLNQFCRLVIHVYLLNLYPNAIATC